MGETFQTRPLADRIGVELTGLQLSNGIGKATIDRIVGLLYSHALVCIRKELTPAQLGDFGACFGRLIHHNEVSASTGCPA